MVVDYLKPRVRGEAVDVLGVAQVVSKQGHQHYNPGNVSTETSQNYKEKRMNWLVTSRRIYTLKPPNISQVTWLLNANMVGIFVALSKQEHAQP